MADGCLAFAELAAADEAEMPAAVDIQPDDVVVLLYSSGTTGLTKVDGTEVGCVHSQLLCKSVLDLYSSHLKPFLFNMELYSCLRRDGVKFSLQFWPFEEANPNLIAGSQNGVYAVAIYMQQGKVTVTGDVEPYLLIKKLEKSGKHAEVWISGKGENKSKGGELDNVNEQLMKLLQMGGGKGGGNEVMKEKGRFSSPPHTSPLCIEFARLLQIFLLNSI